MRPCTDQELALLFGKLVKYMGRDAELLLKVAEPHCFRVHRDRIFYVAENLMRMSTNFKQRRLLTLGTCFAKITRSGKVHLQVTCLDFLAKHALHKVWLKPSAEMTFLYGNNVAKAGLGKITDAADQHAGVVVHSMQDAPLGFGVLARSASGCKDMPPTASIILHQADVGEYLRLENTLF